MATSPGAPLPGVPHPGVPYPGAPYPGGVPGRPVKRVGSVGYWIGALIMAVGIGVGGVLIVVSVTGLISDIENFPTVTLGSEGSVALNRVGCNDLYLFTTSGNTVPASAPDVTLTASGGTDIPVDPSPCSAQTASATNSQPNFRVIGSARIPSAGSYTLKVSRPSGVSAAGYKVAIGKPFDQLVDDRVAPLMGGVASGFFGFVIGLVLLIITGVRRRSARRAALPPPGFAYGYGPGPGGPPPGYGPGPGGPPPGYGPGPGGPPPGYGPGPSAPPPGGPPPVP